MEKGREHSERGKDKSDSAGVGSPHWNSVRVGMLGWAKGGQRWGRDKALVWGAVSRWWGILSMGPKNCGAKQNQENRVEYKGCYLKM